MDQNTRRQKAASCAFGCENGTLSTLYLAENEVEFHSQQGQGNESEENVSEMTVADLQQFIEAATHLLNVTGHEYQQPFDYPVARDII